jgi:hypothetical protein
VLALWRRKKEMDELQAFIDEQKALDPDFAAEVPADFFVNSL